MSPQVRYDFTMHLKSYLASLTAADRRAFAQRAGTSLQYLRHLAAGRKAPTVETCAKVERASAGAVACEELRPDVDWAYLSNRLGTVAPGGSVVNGIAS